MVNPTYNGDAKKINAWLSSNRLQLPFPATHVGNKDVSDNNISQSGENSNTQKEAPIALLADYSDTAFSMANSLTINGKRLPAAYQRARKWRRIRFAG